jgi:hypothetical protein
MPATQIGKAAIFLGRIMALRRVVTPRMEVRFFPQEPLRHRSAPEKGERQVFRRVSLFRDTGNGNAV